MKNILRIGLPAICLILLACFDLTPPVEERLALSFLADGSLRTQLTIELRHPEGKRAASNLGRRLRQLEEDLLAGWDPWSKRFGQAGAAIESFYWEKEAERLVRLERNLVIDDPAALTDLLADTPIHATYRVEDGVAELTFYPGSSGRATRRERREVEQALGEWATAVEGYLQATAALYDYLELQPERATVCFAHFFDSDDAYGELTTEEDSLVTELGDATVDVIEVLDVDANVAYSLDELSRKVYDPFPALFEIELASSAIEVDGFLAMGRGKGTSASARWAIPRFSLWTALESRVGEWLSPDPLTSWMQSQRLAPDGPFDVSAFTAHERWAIEATAAEVEDALAEALTPSDLYRITWRDIEGE